MFAIKISQNGLIESVELDECTTVYDFIREKFPDGDYRVFTPMLDQQSLLVSRIRTTDGSDEDVLNIKSTFLINDYTRTSTTLVGDAYMLLRDHLSMEFYSEQQVEEIMSHTAELNESFSKYAESVNTLKESVVIQ